MGIRFVADSTADLPASWLEEHHVITVPLLVILGDEQLRDGVGIAPATLYRRMRAGEKARTSQPTPADFERAFREASADGSTVICTTISAELSGTFVSAQAGAAAVSGADIRVVDTRSAGPGHHALLRAAVAAAQRGDTVDQVLAVIERVKGAQRLLFCVESLEYLRRGGRIGGASALIGSVLAVKPILQLIDGRVEPRERVRTWQRALTRTADLVREEAGDGPLWIGIAHADNESAATQLAEQLAPLAAAVHKFEVGPVIGCHAGPGTVGVSWFPASLLDA